MGKRAGAEASGQKVGTDRPQLAVVEAVALSGPADPYLPLDKLAEYCGCSVRWLRDRLNDPRHPLPCYRPFGKVLVRRSDFDAWISRYRQIGDTEIDRIVNKALDVLRR